MSHVGAVPGRGNGRQAIECAERCSTGSAMQSILLLTLAFMMLVVGAEYFTNAVEWLGRRLRLSDSATGSLLAALGTATPETLVSIIAIFFAGGGEAKDVGIGGILGAPFMLSTLAML